MNTPPTATGPGPRPRKAPARLAGCVLMAAACGLLPGCAAPVGPVEVTRFHVPETARLGSGTIRVEPVEGETETLEFRTYAAAVMRELTRHGYTAPLPGEPAATQQVARLSIARQTFRPGRNGSPVSVGVGGSTGSYGSGLGLGLGIDLSGPPPEQVETRLSVSIRDGAQGRTLWEGRAAFTVSAKSPLSQAPLGAAKMAEALFKDFPGRSGETILVK